MMERVIEVLFHYYYRSFGNHIYAVHMYRVPAILDPFQPTE
jgi:hypothetical protein